MVEKVFTKEHIQERLLNGSAERPIFDDLDTYRTSKYNSKKIGRIAVIAAGLATASLVTYYAVQSVTSQNNVQPIAPIEVPKDAIPEVPTNGSEPDVSQQENDGPIIVPYKLSNINLGEYGKDCQPDGSYYVSEANIAMTYKGKQYTIEVPKTEVNLYSCGNDVKAFYEDTELVDATMLGIDGSAVAVQVHKKRALINNESIDFTSKIVSKDKPKIIPNSTAQKLQDKGFNGQNVCDVYPELEGCNGEYDLTKEEIRVTQLTIQRFAVLSVGRVCTPQAYDAMKSAIALQFDADAKKQYIDPNYVTEVYTDAAMQPINELPNYIDELLVSLEKKGAITDEEELQKRFGNDITMTAVCDMEAS